MKNIKCKTKYCNREVYALCLCHRCYNREYRKRDLVKTSYQTLKDNAKRRKKIFDITYEQFREFCFETRYLLGKGRNRNSFTIDRKDESKGYTIDNIHVLPNWQNVKKYLDYKWNGEKMEFTTKTIRNKEKSIDNDCPF